MSQIPQELIEREQLVAMGRLAAGIAHEINNPAAFVVANLNELAVAARGVEALVRAALPLAFRTATPEEAADLRQLMDAAHHPGIFEDLRAMVDESLEGMHRIRDIVHHLRGFSIADDSAVVDLVEVTRSAIALLRPELRYRARTTIDLQPTPPLLAPRSQVAQVLLSLLINAMTAFEELPRGERGRVTIATRTGQDGGAVLVIEDDGAPLPEALLNSLDDPFAVPHREDRGLSLRLATSRGIIRRLDGTLEVRSEGGTTVTVRLPAHVPAERPPHPASVAAEDPLTRATILVVDNEPAIVRSLQRLLRHARRVHAATAGEQALELLMSDTPPDLVVCDIIMPGFSGMDLYARIGSERPELQSRFLFITGGALTRETEAFCEAHADRLIEKPFEPTELRERIRELLRRL